MARAARLSGHEDEDPDYEEIEAVLHSQRRDPLTRAKKAVHRLVQRVGFFGILLCASVSVSYGGEPYTAGSVVYKHWVVMLLTIPLSCILTWY